MAARPCPPRRREFDKDPDLAWDIFKKGNEKARQAACTTMDVLRGKMNFDF